MSLICKRCSETIEELSNNELICESCKEDLKLLQNQLEVNQKRIKKLIEHRESTESGLLNNTSKKDQQRLFETLKRIKHNLKIEHEIHKGVNRAMKDKEKF